MINRKTKVTLPRFLAKTNDKIFDQVEKVSRKNQNNTTDVKGADTPQIALKYGKDHPYRNYQLIINASSTDRQAKYLP